MNNTLSGALDGTPLWVVGIGLVLSMGIAATLGWLVRRRVEGAASGDEKASGQDGYIVSGVLGLLALLLGFTFSLAIERFEGRRALVLEEANDIGTTYLRAQILPSPHRERISNLLVVYTNNRIALGTEGPGAQRDTLAHQNDQLLTDLWAETVAVMPAIRDYEYSGAFVEAMNAVIDMDTARKVARGLHVPTEVFVLLLIYQIISAGVLGFVLYGRHGIALATMLCLLFTLSLLLIMDVDRPTSGGVTESQKPMLLLRDSLASQPPEVFNRTIEGAAPALADPAAF
jgi:hypothetical protein